MSTIQKPKKRVKNKKPIPYYPELNQLISSLGFTSSTKVFIYLQQCGINYVYVRTLTAEARLTEKIEDLRKDQEVGFIFTMDVDIRSPNGNKAVDLIHFYGLSKNELIKYLELKAFS